MITQIQRLEKPSQLKDYRTKEPVLVFPGGLKELRKLTLLT